MKTRRRTNGMWRGHGKSARRLVVSLVACMAAAAGAIVGANWADEAHASRNATRPDTAHSAVGPTAHAAVAGVGGTTQRPNYRYSVIPHGAYTPGALVSAIARDPVVAREYAHVSLADMRTDVVAAPRMAYMSYRIGDEIYWTKEKVPLSAGETVLTDGVTEIRSRCGNAISETPGRTFESEPDEREFALLEAVDEPDAPPSAALAGVAEPMAPPSAALAGADAGVAQPMAPVDPSPRAGRSLGKALIPAVLGAPFWALQSSRRCTPSRSR